MIAPVKRSKFHRFDDATLAFAAIESLYAESLAYLRACFSDFVRDPTPPRRYRAYYPALRITVSNAFRLDTRLSYGFVPRAGTYETTLTRTDIFDHYLKEQIRLLLHNHGGTVEVGPGEAPLPIHFALGEDFHLEQGLGSTHLATLPAVFDVPNLDLMDDEIANGTYVPGVGKPAPLALFTAPRIDLSLMRLRHYTGTNAAHFQNYIIFTNYQFYIDEFVQIARDMMSGTDDPALRAERSVYSAFVEPANRITHNANLPDAPSSAPVPPLAGDRLPQMPAYHLKRPDGSGITMINIGIGPSNAKTITDHVAVLRPHAWLMLGHCAGLRTSQKLGDYVLAHGYLRQDNVLYHDIHPSIPIPPLAEVQLALEQAVATVTGLAGYDLKTVMRTGTVATVDDRNWELRTALHRNQRFSQSRAIALDMESGTIAANGFRFRVPYGTLLCVSDKPLHGQLKLPGMADAFYRERVEQHLRIGLLSMNILRDTSPERLHSRKLRSFNEVAFQ